MRTKLLFLTGLLVSVMLGCTKENVPEEISTGVFTAQTAQANADTVLSTTAAAKPAISFQVTPFEWERPPLVQPIELLAQLNNSGDATPYVVRGYVTRYRMRGTGVGGDYFYGSVGDFEFVCTGQYSQKVVLRLNGEELTMLDYFSVVIESITPDATYEVFDSRAYGIAPF